MTNFSFCTLEQQTLPRRALSFPPLSSIKTRRLARFKNKTSPWVSDTWNNKQSLSVTKTSTPSECEGLWQLVPTGLHTASHSHLIQDQFQTWEQYQSYLSINNKLKVSRPDPTVLWFEGTDTCLFLEVAEFTLIYTLKAIKQKTIHNMIFRAKKSQLPIFRH